jgi:hypothetical protein
VTTKKPTPAREPHKIALAKMSDEERDAYGHARTLVAGLKMYADALRDPETVARDKESAMTHIDAMWSAIHGKRRDSLVRKKLINALDAGEQLYANAPNHKSRGDIATAEAINVFADQYSDLASKLDKELVRGIVTGAKQGRDRLLAKLCEAIGINAINLKSLKSDRMRIKRKVPATQG